MIINYAKQNIEYQNAMYQKIDDDCLKDKESDSLFGYYGKCELLIKKIYTKKMKLLEEYTTSIGYHTIK